MFWLATASSRGTDTWVNLVPSSGADDTDVDLLLLALRDGDDSVLVDMRLLVTNRGRHVGDMLWAQGQMFTAISQRVVDTLTAVGATGWRAVPAATSYADGTDLPGYHLLVVTGSCSALKARGAPLGSRPGNAPPRGWDGSDVFWLDDRPPQFTFCVTDRIRRVLQDADLTRMTFEHPAEF